MGGVHFYNNTEIEWVGFYDAGSMRPLFWVVFSAPADIPHKTVPALDGLRNPQVNFLGWEAAVGREN